MALRYLLIVGRSGALDTGMAHSAATRLGMQIHHRAPNIVCLTSGGRAPLILDDAPITIVGDLFHRFGAGPRLDNIDPTSIAAIAVDPEGVLLSRFWGAYVAFWANGDTTTVLRDPSGLLPCWYTVQERHITFASDPHLLFELDEAQPSIDWDGVSNLLYADDLAQIRTGLTGVSQLLAGSAFQINSSICGQFARWSPWQFAAKCEGQSAQDYREDLRRSVELSVRGWSSSYSKLLLAVSGGLDSSIVASCLDPKTDRECITMATPDPRGDETEYARELCTKLSLRLGVFQYQLEDADVRRSAVSHLPRPGARAPMVAYDAAINRYLDQVGADLFLTGVGGDNVFYLTHSVRPVVDRYLTEGLTLGLLDTIRDVAKITEVSPLEVVSQALRFFGKRRRKYEWRCDGSFLHRDVAQRLRNNPPKHPWLTVPKDVLPGKAGHIAMIARAQQYLHGYDRRRSFTSIAPLLSQPVVESALSIPSWHCCAGGIDRSVARNAFEGRIPRRIVERRVKGGPDAFALQILRSNMGLVKERLLNGNLARNGILDLPAVEAALTARRLGEDASYVRLLLLLDTEAWIESWLNHSADGN